MVINDNDTDFNNTGWYRYKWVGLAKISTDGGELLWAEDFSNIFMGLI